MSGLSWSNEQRAALLEEIPSGMAVFDRDLTIVEHNRAFGEMFGEAQGHRCYEVLHQRTAPCAGCAAEGTFAGGTQCMLEATGKDRHGGQAYFLVQLSPVRDRTGEITHVAAITTDLTATHRLQQEYRTLFEKVPCFVAVINRDHRVVKANERFRHTFGEPTGEHCYQLYKQRRARCEDCPVDKTFADGASHSSRQVGTSRDGRVTHYLVFTAPLVQGDNGEVSHVIEMALDMTAHQNLEERLSRADVMRLALVENAHVAIVVLDEKQRVVLANRAAEALLDVGREELQGRRASPRLIPRTLQRVLSGKDHEALPHEASVTTAAGVEVPVRVSAVGLRIEDRFLGAAVMAQDLRELKRLEREKVDAERLAAVGQTVAGLAHGIKNILTGLEGGMYVTSTGLRKRDEGRIQQGWDMLERNMGRISTLVKNLLAFSRGDEPTIELVDPVAVARDVVDLYRESAEHQGLSLILDAASPVEPAPMDAEGLHSCLANLVSNAMDACLVSQHPGCSVSLAVRDEGGTIVMEVSDGGCGMDYEVKQKAFTSFFTTKGAGGTGLGLLITRKIVQQHGGFITFESTPGMGTSFKLSFPRDRLPQPPRPEQETEENHA